MSRQAQIAASLSIILAGCGTTNLGQNGTLYSSGADEHSSWHIVSGVTTTTTAGGTTSIEKVEKKVFLCTEPAPRVTKDEKKDIAAAVTANLERNASSGSAGGSAGGGEKKESRTVVLFEPSEITVLRELLYAVCQLSVNISSLESGTRDKVVSLYEKVIEQSKPLLQKTPIAPSKEVDSK